MKNFFLALIIFPLLVRAQNNADQKNESHKDWPKAIYDLVALLDQHGELDTSAIAAGTNWALINNSIYEVIFYHCDNKDTLNKAITWMEQINKAHPDDWQDLDTYANLLYKVGRNKEALKWEEKAKQLEDAAAQKEKRNPDPIFAETVDKMKKGIPTWQ